MTARSVSAAGAEARTPSEPSSLPSLRSEEHTSELQSRVDVVCRLLLEKKKISQSHCWRGLRAVARPSRAWTVFRFYIAPWSAERWASDRPTRTLGAGNIAVATNRKSR